MENYKKEKCSRQHLKIDVIQDQSEDIFTLANPMTCGGMTSPTSPPNSSQAISNPNTPTNPSPHQAAGFTRGEERLSLKSKAKNQSFFKIFSRSSSSGAGGNHLNSNKEEEFVADASSGSDHEDPFSPNSSAGTGDLVHAHRQMSEPHRQMSEPHRQMSEPLKSPSSNAEHYSALPKQQGRHHRQSGGHSSRDSGFSSERESISHLKEDMTATNQTFNQSNVDDVRVSPSDREEYRPAGMEALEILHNQLQLLVKCESDEDTDSVSVYEQVIANLSKQLEDQSLSLDTLKYSETNLKLALRLCQQRAMEAEAKLVYAAERCLQAERKYAGLSTRYKCLRRKQMVEGSTQLRHSKAERRRHTSKAPHISPHSSLQSSSSSYQQPPNHTSQPSDDPSRIPPQRVQSQTLYDRENKLEQNGTKRPNTAQGFHHDEDNIVASIASLSHTETSV